MSAILDHLTAILVGAVLVGALVFVQMRRQETAVQTTVRNRVEMQTGEFLAVLQRDAENVRTRRQTEQAFGAYRFSVRRATGPDGETYTKQLSFPTLLDPSQGSASPVALITYEMTPTGETVRVGASRRPTYGVVRHEYTRGGGSRTTGGAVGILDLDVMLVGDDGAETSSDDVVDPIPSQVRIAVMAAAEGALRRASDQTTTTPMNATRRATTVRVIGATASEGLPPVQPGPAGIPSLPGDPPPPPPPPPSPPSSPSPSGGSGGSSGGGSSGPPPPPPPPAPPPPPRGQEI